MTTNPKPRYSDDLFKDSTMTFGEHLDELRSRLWKATAGIAVGCLVGLWLGPYVVNFIQTPVQQALQAYTQEKALDDAKKLGLENQIPGATSMIREGYYFEEWMVEPQNYTAVTGGKLPSQADGESPLDFNPHEVKVGALAASWVKDAKEPDSLAARWFKLLSNDEKTLLSQLAESSNEATEDQHAAVVALLNRLAADPALAESVRQPTPLKLQLSETTQALLANPQLPKALQPRLGRWLLHDAYPTLLAAPKLELRPLVLWRTVDKHPRADSKVLTVLEPFSIWMTASLVVGAVIAGPWVFFQIWMFVAAGLYPHERNYVYLYGPMSLGLFAAGVCLAFFFVFPPVLGFLFGVMKSLGIDIELRLSDWITFVLMLPIGFGISFQLPLVMLFLNRIGLFSLEQYISQWRIAVMVIFVLSAVLTPADPQSMLLMALPLCFLYMFGLVLCRFLPNSAKPAAASDIQRKE